MQSSGTYQGDSLQSITALIVDDEEEIREAISGNICRCTGYQGIVLAAKEAASKMAKDRN